MKQDRYLFNKFGITYERVGEVSHLHLLGFLVFARVGSAWWMLGIKRTGVYDAKDGKWH